MFLQVLFYYIEEGGFVFLFPVWNRGSNSYKAGAPVLFSHWLVVVE
jgi:hypothetical protein